MAAGTKKPKMKCVTLFQMEVKYLPNSTRASPEAKGRVIPHEISSWYCQPDNRDASFLLKHASPFCHLWIQQYHLDTEMRTQFGTKTTIKEPSIDDFGTQRCQDGTGRRTRYFGPLGSQDKCVGKPRLRGYCIRHFTTERSCTGQRGWCGCRSPPFVNCTLIRNTPSIYVMREYLPASGQG